MTDSILRPIHPGELLREEFLVPLNMDRPLGGRKIAPSQVLIDLGKGEVVGASYVHILGIQNLVD